MQWLPFLLKHVGKCACRVLSCLGHRQSVPITSVCLSDLRISPLSLEKGRWNRGTLWKTPLEFWVMLIHWLLNHLSSIDTWASWGQRAGKHSHGTLQITIFFSSDAHKIWLWVKHLYLPLCINRRKAANLQNIRVSHCRQVVGGGGSAGHLATCEEQHPYGVSIAK